MVKYFLSIFRPKESIFITKNKLQPGPLTVEVKEGIVLVDGWFKDTLPKFVEQNSSPIKFIHVDSDNYNSAKDVFDNLGHLIVPGTVIKFDEYRYYNGWRFREYRAFKEFIKTTSFDYDYIVRSSNNEKAALRIK